MARGIEKRKVFLDERDLRLFAERLSALLVETKTECFAWALLPSHLHLLLRPGDSSLATLMRRLLTSHAVRFNRRHRRAGHLFQNRYKSIVCEEEPYLLELLRYIHLNPLRAGLVRGLSELAVYPWSGHAVLLGKRDFPGQVTDEILGRFAHDVAEARRYYTRFVQEGIARGRRPELSTAPPGSRTELGRGPDARGSGDARVLGSEAFLEALRSDARLQGQLRPTLSLSELVDRTAQFCGVAPGSVRRPGRRKEVADARALICYLGVRKLGFKGTEVARELGIGRSAVSLAVRRGERLAAGRQELGSLRPF
jgi:REP element-mobilizing transposase RayT